MEMSEDGGRPQPSAFGGALAAVLAGLAAASVAALLVGAVAGRELVLVPLVVLPGAVAGYLLRRDGFAGGLVAGLLSLLLALLGFLLLPGSDEPRSLLEFLAAWVYPGAGIVLGNSLAGILAALIREEGGS